jgi:hypothetical protein
VKITTEQDTTKLNEENYLIISTSPKKVIFNDYKTDRTYGKQIFEIPANLDNIINKYISNKRLKPNDYLFGLDRDKREYINQPNFSKKISDVFNEVYNIPISLRFLRQSHISYLLKTNPTVKAMKQLATAMAHSTDEQKLYNKILK